jgi:hypothetical protein
MTYETGYGKPPKHTQFKKGQSGNPRGRPKGSVNLATAITRAVNERVTVNVNGRPRSMTKLDVAITGLVNRAVKGDARATQQLLSLAPLVGMDAAPAGHLPETDALILKSVLQRVGCEEVGDE